MDQPTKTARVKVTGRVQGVGFRAWTHRQALGLGVRGWVRNEADGSVTAVVAGEAGAVSLMLDRLRHGPPGSAVQAVTTEAADEAPLPAGFEIRY